MKLAEYRRTVSGVPDLLQYASLVDDGVLMLQNGGLMATWAFRGPDLASATHAEMAGLSSQLNSLLKLGSGWMIHCDVIRGSAPAYPAEGHFPDLVTKLIDRERRNTFMREGSHFETDYYLNLTYLPPMQKEEKIKGYMFSAPGEKESDEGIATRILDYFKGKAETFDAQLSLLLKARRLKRVVEVDEFGNDFYFDDQLRYVRRAVQGLDYKFALPEIPVFLHEIIGGIDLVGGTKPVLGGRHMAVIAIDSFPSVSTPGFLAALDSLAFEYRWNTRALLLDPEESRSKLERLFKKWRGMERSFMAQLMGKDKGVINQHAVRMATDAASAMSVAAAGDVQFALYSSNIIILDSNRSDLDDKVGEVVKILRNGGFGARVEEMNSLEAWCGSLPGEGNRNPRRFMMHTLNLSDCLPIAAIWTGHKVNPSSLMPPASPPLLLCTSTGATPFRLHLHVQDLGHTVVIGPPGSGKSTMLALLVAQWFRYPNARVVCFDKGYSMFVLNQAAGGNFYDLGGERDSINFCPLADLGTSSDRAWAADYIETLVTMGGVVVTAQIRNLINEAIQRMARVPESRSLMDFVATVQDREVRDAMMNYTSVGSNGSLLDASEDKLRDSRFLVFEMDTLMGSGDSNSRGLIAVLLYLFRQIEKRLDGSPTLIVLDEAWVFLRHAQFRSKIREWLKVMRKMNAVVVMATQSLSDVMNSDISDVILESCPTKILLANTEANTEISRAFYQRIGLNSREITMIAKAVPKLHYYVSSADGRRLVTLGIGAAALSFVGVSSVENRRLAQSMQERYGADWVYEWLRLRAASTGTPALLDWAALYQNALPVTKLEESVK